MSDPKKREEPSGIRRVLSDCEAFAAEQLADWDDTNYWLDELRNGHPKAQDFEPTGHGGSDPTSVNGIRPDTAREDRKAIESDLRAAWRSLNSARKRSLRYRTATRPARQPDDAQDVWCALHLLHDAYEPRYRNELCRPCAERKYQTGDFPSKDDVAHHIRKGRWPTTRVDPKTHIASVSRLTLGTGALTAEQAAEKLA